MIVSVAFLVRAIIVWLPLSDSNAHRLVRSQEFYPLN